MIRVLSDNVINKIAAGEVVDRPASALRELLENAIDAGADRITIDLERGGKHLIRIRDNGCGMSQADAKMSLHRHATSKIRTEAELFEISSLGFRGEAVPSIASVSRFSLRTKPKEEEVGTEIHVEGGVLISVDDIGCPSGSEFTVRNLFYNVPARQKFLRTDATEMSHCLETVIREMLIRPNIDITVNANRSQIVRAQHAKTLSERAGQLLGPAGRDLIPIDVESAGYRIHGLLSPVGVHRSNAQNNAYIYVNGRFIKDTAIRRAIRDAYRGLVPKGRFPTIVLCIEAPTHEVDVNVHPAKTEVRFHRIRELGDALTTHIRKALEEEGIHRPQEPIQPIGEAPAPKPIAMQSVQHGLDLQLSTKPSTPITKQYKSQLSGALTLKHPEKKQENPIVNPVTIQEESLFPLSDVDGIIEDNPTHTQVESSPYDDMAVMWPADKTPLNDPNSLLPVARFEDLSVIGQLNETYILCQGGGELVIIDQHAAHERIMLHRLVHNKVNALGASQGLLTPKVVSLSSAQSQALLAEKERLLNYGLDMDAFGGADIIIRSCPQALLDLNHQRLLSDLADDLMQTGRTGALDNFIENRLATRACHNSIRAGDKLTPFRMKELLAELDGVDFEVCAHGRPVAIRISAGELEKRFHRN